MQQTCKLANDQHLEEVREKMLALTRDLTDRHWAVEVVASICRLSSALN